MDTLGNLLTSLINAQRIGKKRIVVPYSRLNESLVTFLQQKGRVAKVRRKGAVEGETGYVQEKLIVTLAYDGKKPALHGVRRLSKPGQRRYVAHTSIPYSFDGMGMIVVSTSQGLRDDKTARKERVGGELLCEVW